MARRFQFGLKWLFAAMLFVPTFYAGREAGVRLEHERLAAEWAKAKEAMQDASDAQDTAIALRAQAKEGIEGVKAERLWMQRARAALEGK